MASQSGPPTIADYLAALRHRPWLVVLTMITMANLAFGALGRGGPVFEAEAEVLVRSTEAQQAFDTTNAAANRNLLANEVRFADGDILRTLVIERLQLEIEPEDLKVDVSAADGADLLVFSSIATTAERATDLANTYAELYVEERRRRAVESYTGAIATLEQQITDSQTRRETLNSELTALRVEIAGLPEDSDRRLGLEQTLAQREAELSPTLLAIEAEETQLLNSLSSLRVSSELAKAGTAEIVSEAFPGDPNPSRRLPSIFIGALIGLVAGSVAAVSLERLGDTVRSVEDLTRRFPQHPVLGSLPKSSMAPREQGPQTRSRPTSPFAEAILQIRASIGFLANEDAIEMVTVTSPNAGEGKTTLATSLAWSMASLSEHIVLIDADLRRPSVHRHFPIDNITGTTEYVTGTEPLLECAQRFNEQADSFVLLTAGAGVRNPADLMANPRTIRHLRQLSEQGRVVIDGAPILPVSDSRAISGASDLTILVVRLNSTKLSEVEEALKRIELTGTSQIGLVVNGVTADSTPYVSSRRFWHRRRKDELPTLRPLDRGPREAEITEELPVPVARKRVDPLAAQIADALPDDRDDVPIDDPDDDVIEIDDSPIDSEPLDTEPFDIEAEEADDVDDHDEVDETDEVSDEVDETDEIEASDDEDDNDVDQPTEDETEQVDDDADAGDVPDDAGNRKAPAAAAAATPRRGLFATDTPATEKQTASAPADIDLTAADEEDEPSADERPASERKRSTTPATRKASNGAASKTKPEDRAPRETTSTSNGRANTSGRPPRTSKGGSAAQRPRSQGTRSSAGKGKPQPKQQPRPRLSKKK